VVLSGFATVKPWILMFHNKTIDSGSDGFSHSKTIKTIDSDVYCFNSSTTVKLVIFVNLQWVLETKQAKQ